MTTHTAHYACYRRGCRRDECRTADRIYRKQYELRRLAGVPSHIPGPVVTAHIRHVLDSGRTIRSISAEAQVSERAINYILNGQEKVTRIKALALLAVHPLDEAPRVDPTGTIRRIQALAAIGWPIIWTAEQTGYHYSYVFTILGGRLHSIPRPVAQRVAALYREYSRRQGHSQHTRTIARRNGWHGPLAWDDIDDPNERPETEQPVENELSRNELAAVRRAEIEHLDGFNLPTHEIAARLGIGESTVAAIVRELHSGRRRQRKPVAA